MKKATVEELGAKMDALGLWDSLVPYNFAVKPRGTVFPYFCTVVKEDGKPVKVRFLMLEGWQTLHDFVRVRVDHNFGFYSSPIEFPRYELIVLASGETKVFRYDTGYMPVELTDAAVRDFVARILWEAFGIFLRVESDPKLLLKFADDRSVFARVEDRNGKWTDQPLPIPDPPPHKESVTLPKEIVKSVKDLPIKSDAIFELDFRLVPNVMTKEPRPRCIYALVAKDGATGETLMDSQTSIVRECGIRGLWESMPVQVLRELSRLGRVPGEIRVRSGRVFRMLRPLCLEFPFKLSLHDKLTHIA